MIDQASFRRTLGHFCTGVTVVTGLRPNGEPVGFACQSFTALSLDPPLVLFCPGRGSRTWPEIEASGRFCVNVLAEGQRETSSVFGRSGDDKFAGVPWRPASSGAPVIDGVLAWIDCTIEQVHDGGDHYIVIGRVQTLGQPTEDSPLLFFKGAYAGVDPARAQPAPSWAEELLAWSRTDEWI